MKVILDLQQVEFYFLCLETHAKNACDGSLLPVTKIVYSRSSTSCSSLNVFFSVIKFRVTLEYEIQFTGTQFFCFMVILLQLLPLGFQKCIETSH